MPVIDFRCSPFKVELRSEEGWMDSGREVVADEFDSVVLKLSKISI
jgi:hypothetical protein